MQPTQNLWPSEFGDVQIPVPVQILANQADYFNKTMQNVLVASIVSHFQESSIWNENAQMVHDFRIKVPALGSYSLTILSIYHDPIKLYPVRIEDKISEHQQTGKGRFINLASNEDEIMHRLKEIFGSREMAETIASLKAQSKYSVSGSYSS